MSLRDVLLDDARDAQVAQAERIRENETDELSTATGGTAAPSDATFVVISLNAVLTNERVLAVDPPLTLTDAGAGGDITISLDLGGAVIYDHYEFDGAAWAIVTNLNIADDAFLYFGNDQDVLMTYDEAGADIFSVTGADWLINGPIVNIGTAEGAGGELLALRVDQNATTAMEIVNASAGAGASATLRVKNTAGATGADAVIIGVTGTAWAATDLDFQDAGIIQTGANLAGGLTIRTRGATPVVCGVNDADEVWRADANGMTIPDDVYFNLGTDQDARLRYDEAGDNRLEIEGTDWYFDTVDVTLSSVVTAHPVLALENTNDDGAAPTVDFYKDSGSPLAGDDLGAWDFFGNTSTGAKDRYAYFFVESLDVTNGATGGGMQFRVVMNGTERNLIDVAGFTGTPDEGEVVINQDGQDVDFRVEANGVADAFQVLGNNGEITLGVLGAGFVQSTAGGVLSSAAIGAGDLPAHTHAGAGQGGQLDWDDVWSDAVHDHTVAGEGGQLTVAALSDLAYAAPALTFTTANAAGVANTVLRTDASLAIFDVTVVDVIQPDDAATTGVVAFAARRDHTHGIVTAAPGANLTAATANAEGVATSFARSDHSHAITTASDGAANHSTILRSNASGQLTLDDLFVPDGGVVGISAAAERIEFYTAGIIATRGAKVGISTIAVPHGAIGAAKLAMDGTNASVDGPHMQFTTASDNYPTMQILNWSHDVINIAFDGYYDGAWKSSDIGSNFAIRKRSDQLQLSYESGVAQGGAVTWTEGVIMTTGGLVGVNVVATSQLHVDQSDNAANIPVLTLDQGDTSEQCINVRSDGADRDIHILTVDVTETPFLDWDNSENSLVYGVNTANTNVITDVLTLRQTTSGTAASLFGSAISFELEDSAGNSQAAAEIATLWATATSGAERPLVRINTFPSGTRGPGNSGFWTGNDVTNATQVIIPPGAGDVTGFFWCRFVVVESGGGTATGTVEGVAPGDPAEDIYDDGVDVFSLTVAAGGQVSVIRTAGASTADISLLMNWI